MQKVHSIHLDSVDSTNTWVKSHANEFDPNELTYVTAKVQTAGRGRHNRRWVSKAGNLHMTLFFCLEKGDERIPNLAQLMALALCHLFPAQIKWPNDLVVEEKKLAGILVELIDIDRRQGVVLGLGLNANAPVETDQPTTSLSQWLGNEWNLNELAEQIAYEFLSTMAKGFSSENYNEKLAFKGESISCQIGTEQINGRLIGVDEKGQLQLQLKSGEIRLIRSGDLLPYQG